MVTGYSEGIFPSVVDSDDKEYEDESMATFFLKLYIRSNICEQEIH